MTKNYDGLPSNLALRDAATKTLAEVADGSPSVLSAQAVDALEEALALAAAEDLAAAAQLSAPRLHAIFIEVAAGRGHHGDFLKSFANAFLRADMVNTYVLLAPAQQLVEKYGLQDYGNGLRPGGEF